MLKRISFKFYGIEICRYFLFLFSKCLSYKCLISNRGLAETRICGWHNNPGNIFSPIGDANFYLKIDFHSTATDMMIFKPEIVKNIQTKLKKVFKKC